MSKNEKMSKKTKTTRTHSIDDSLYDEFIKIVEDKMYNKSKIIESLIKDWVNKNKQ
jgi:hypothetical protein